jgi:hypothetical protein
MALSWTGPPGTTSSPALSGSASLDRVPLDVGSLDITPAFEQLAQRIRSEYREMPGLNVTRDQARCLWALDPDECDRLLAHLVRSGFLARTAQNTYVRAS